MQVKSFTLQMEKLIKRLRNKLVLLGLVAGAPLACGLVVLPGILSGYDSEGSVAWYLYVAGLNALSGAILYPIWCIWLGRTLLRK